MTFYNPSAGVGGQAPGCLDLLGNQIGFALSAFLMCLQALLLWNISETKGKSPQQPPNQTTTAKREEVTTGHLLGSAPTRGSGWGEAFLSAAKAAQLSKNCGEFSKERLGTGSVSVVLIEGPIPVSATWIQPSFAFKNSGLGFLAAAPDPGWKLTSPLGLKKMCP